ncbi:acetyltransferase [Oceanobacillus jeddahense]|uniref:acetyltransferase n=1 Tax=Oceanobacillus jeddahense TaxID=1462527 RepID=UPI00059606B5|nr:acetyltransferase [Oceanobacillus jeddahense]
MKKLVIIGSGGFSKQVIEIVEKINDQCKTYDLIGLIDDNKSFIGEKILNYEVIGTTEYLYEYSQNNEVYGVIAIANAEVKKQLSNKLSLVKWVNLIHPDAIITNYINMGIGNIICGGVIINPDCTIHNHCHINIGSTFGHDVTLMDFITVMPGCKISGNVTLENSSMIGTGSTIIQGITIKEKSVLGAGAVVINHIDKQSLYVGVPAKKVKEL